MCGMAFLPYVLLFLLGLVLVVKGGDWFVSAARWVSEASGIPPLIVGATVVSLATAGPELVVSVLAAGQGRLGLASGNAIGSITANLGLILGISLTVLPAGANRSMRTKLALMLFSAALLWVSVADGVLSVLESWVFIGLFFLFIAENVLAYRQRDESLEKPVKRIKITKKDVSRNLFLFAIGLAALLTGANVLVDNGSELALLFGVPEHIVGITLVAIGTSLPEFITTVTALSKGDASLSVGNVIGANIIDICLILPLCSLIGGQLALNKAALFLHIPVLVLLCALSALPALHRQRFARWQGVLLLLVFVVQLLLVCLQIGQ